MLSILLSIFIASRVTKLKAALIGSILVPISLAILFLNFSLIQPNPIGLILSIVLSPVAAYITFRRADKKRKSGNIRVKTKQEKITAFIMMIIILGMLGFLGYLGYSIWQARA